MYFTTSPQLVKGREQSFSQPQWFVCCALSASRTAVRRASEYSNVTQKHTRYISSMNLYFRTLSGRSIMLLGIDMNDTVRSIKEQIRVQEGFSCDAQRIILAGTVLEDSWAVRDCEFASCAFAHLVIASRPLSAADTTTAAATAAATPAATTASTTAETTAATTRAMTAVTTTAIMTATATTTATAISSPRRRSGSSD